DIAALRSLATETREARNLVAEFTLADGRRIYLLADGRLVNLAVAEGHPAQVMDMSFANQALAAEYIVENAASLEKKVYDVPEDIDKEIAGLKLERLKIGIDELDLVTNSRFAPACRDWAQTLQQTVAKSDVAPLVVHDDGTVTNDDRLGAIGDLAFTIDRAGLVGEELFVVAGDNLIGYSLPDYVEFWRVKGGSAIALHQIGDRALL